MSNNKKYYEVTVPRGHWGCGKAGEITFYFKAYDAYHAMMLAKKMPSVKHGKLCFRTREITAEEYYEKRKVSSYVRGY